jgi:ferrous iron transport protein B
MDGMTKTNRRKADNDNKLPVVAIVGNPNVGKSVVFTRLTGHYAAASNYPGTTVEVMRGNAEIDGRRCSVVDTPGMYSLLPVTEEEEVARAILLQERPDVVVHVVDARNLDRMLVMTLELAEMGIPLVLAVNMLDEAESAGISLELATLAERLGVPVAGVVAVTGRGMDELKRLVVSTLDSPPPAPMTIGYAPHIEKEITAIESCLAKSGESLDRRARALLILQGDDGVAGDVEVSLGCADGADAVRHSGLEERLEIATARHDRVAALLDGCVSHPEVRITLRERLSRVMTNPLTGLPILAVVLYYGLYKFVGGFGAGTVVDFLESTVFEKFVNPFLVDTVGGMIPWDILTSLFVGEYGVLTLGLRYAVAIILPIVAFFFLIFAVIEDSGYLPRLALLLDRTFKKIGLSGRGVIPMVLGFGCDTMATMVTRTLPTRRERLLSTMLLALAIPCSAQLGVILALLEDHTLGMFVWAGVVTGVFLLVGWISAKILPGEGPSFYMEVPPLRLPRLGNVLTKTYVRVRWYFLEIVPMFLIASILIWAGEISGIFGAVVSVLEGPVQWIGLPVESADVFLMGFFRRDYGAAGLYDLNKAGLLSPTQLVVACVALTLFLPCVAQLLINFKERGWKTGLAVSGLVLVMSFGVAYTLNAAFTVMEVSL